MIRDINSSLVKSLFIVGTQPFSVVIVDPLFPHNDVASYEHKHTRSINGPVSDDCQLPSLVGCSLFVSNKTEEGHKNQ